MMRPRSWLLVAALTSAPLGLASCGAGLRGQLAEAAARGDFARAWSSYESLRASDGDDDELLALVAESLLLREARGDEEAARAAAIQQLALAGTRGRRPLEALSRSEGPAAVEALVALARVGHRDAQRLLRGMADSEDPSVRAASVLGMAPEQDGALLLAWCGDPSRLVREAACARLGDLAPDTAALDTLGERARIDPDARVRATASRALGRFGAAASIWLRDRLSDADPRVRDAALEALLRADREAGRQAVSSILETPTSATTLEAARLLATTLDAHAPPTDDERARARAHLFAALVHPDAGLRGQAAMALLSVGPDAETARALLPLVEREPDVAVRLSLARALAGRDGVGQAARAALGRILAEDHGMIGLQAAIVLTAVGDEAGLVRLRAELSSPEASLRRVAARAIARDALRPSEARPLLEDADAAVRIAAAGGILAAAAARE
ncbi:MAG: hypothetical protein OHK0013_00790 [Sandaracinaceae bacterium]